MEEKTCCFTGNRPEKLPFGYDEDCESCIELKKKIKDETERMILERNVKHFISGMAQGVDIYAAEIVLELKEKYEITLECAIPYRKQSENFKHDYKERYDNIISKADKVNVLNESYTKICMHKRNQYMVDCSDYVIAVYDGSKSGTHNTVQYAKRKGKEVFWIVTA